MPRRKQAVTHAEKVAERDPGTEPARRSKIVEAATDLFLARGFDAVPLSQVAEAAGVKTPALYWHFKSKMDLYVEVLETSYRSTFAELVRRTTGNDPRQRLHSYVRSMVEMQLSNQDFVFGRGQLLARLPADKRAVFTRLQRAYGTYVTEILQQGIDDGQFDVDDLSMTVLAIHTMCEYAVVWYRPDHRLSAGEVAEFHAGMALRMVGASRD